MVEALTWRIQVQGPVPSGRLRLTVGRDADVLKQGERMAVFPGYGAVSCLVLNRYGLRPGETFPGPVLVEEDETTTVVGPGAMLEVDPDGNLVITLS